MRTSRPTRQEVPRFDLVTRVVHWLIALLVLTMLGTGTILYVGQLEATVGRRALLARIHVASGLLMVFVFGVVAIARPATSGLRAELRTLGRWSDGDRKWLRRATRTTTEGKYNGGQKLLTAAFGGLLVAQLATGAVMHWNQPFPDDWRTGATFVHDWAYLALTAVVLGHVVRAIGEPNLLRSMRTGSVPRSWAQRERPVWLAELDAAASADSDQ